MSKTKAMSLRVEIRQLTKKAKGNGTLDSDDVQRKLHKLRKELHSIAPPMENRSVRAPVEDWKKWKRAADLEGVSLAEWVRIACNRVANSKIGRNTP